MAFVRIVGMLTWTVVPAAAALTWKLKVAAKNQPMMAPEPPLPVTFSALGTEVLVNTVVYKGYTMLWYVSLLVLYTKLAPKAESVFVPPVCAHIFTVTESPGTAT